MCAHTRTHTYTHTHTQVRLFNGQMWQLLKAPRLLSGLPTERQDQVLKLSSTISKYRKDNNWTSYFSMFK
jgi:hypothetical protein